MTSHATGSGARRVLVTGSREWGDERARGAAQARAEQQRLADVLAEHYRQGAVLVHGDARGADRLAASWWRQRGGEVVDWPARWSSSDRSAGFRRNAAMVAAGADVCLAFMLPGTRGTADCAGRAEKAGIRVERIAPPLLDDAPVRAGTDLFGQKARPARAPKKAPTESNDMDLVTSVIRTATVEGYALVGTGQRVYRRIADKEIERVPAYESEMVHQLLRRGLLKAGGNHTFTYGGNDGPGRSVLVPKSTKSMMNRQSALVRLPAPRAARPSTPSAPSSDRLVCPQCGEAAQQKKPTRWSPSNGPTPKYSHIDGEPLCPVMGSHGYVPARPQPLDHEER